MDPTGLAALSLVMTIFAMITTAIPTVIDRNDKRVNAKRAIISSTHIVESCRNRYTQWAGEWNWSEPSQKVRLERLLGTEQYAAIQKRVESVAGSSARVLTMLKLESDSKESSAHHLSKAWKDVVAWTASHIDRSHGQKFDGELPRYVRELNKFCLDTTFTPSKPTKLYHIRWVLYRKTQLKDHIDDLKADIDELLEYSDFILYQKKLGTFDTSAIQAALHKDNFRRDASAIYNILSMMPNQNSEGNETVTQKESWSLILQDFEDADLEEVAKNTIQQFSLEFGCYIVGERSPPPEQDGMSNDADVSCLRLRLKYDKTLPAGAALATSRQKEVLEGTCFWKSSTSNIVEIEHKTPPYAKWTASLRQILCQCHKEPRLFKSLQLEFSRLAFAICFWALLLSDTLWLSNLCSCGFRGVVPHGRLQQPTELKEEDGQKFEYSFYSRRPECQGICETVPKSALMKGAGSSIESGYRKLTGDMKILGVLLCELFLGRPIDRVPALAGAAWGTVKEIERQGYGKFTSSNVRNAVVWCLSSARIANSPDSTTGSGLNLTAEEQKDFSNAVIKPLQKHFTTLNEHKTRYPSTEALKQLDAKKLLQEGFDTKLIHCKDLHDFSTAAKTVSKSEVREMGRNASQPSPTTIAVDDDDMALGDPHTGRSVSPALEELHNLVSKFGSQDPERALTSDDVENFKLLLLEKLSDLENYIKDNVVKTVRPETASMNDRVEAGRGADGEPFQALVDGELEAGTIVRELGRVQAALSRLFETLNMKEF